MTRNITPATRAYISNTGNRQVAFPLSPSQVANAASNDIHGIYAGPPTESDSSSPNAQVWRQLRHDGQKTSSPYPVPFSSQQTYVVRAGHGFAFHVPTGYRFRIFDLYGEQVVDMMAWVVPDVSSSFDQNGPSPAPGLPSEKLSMSYSRYHLRGATPAIGDYLYTNADRALLKLTRDTCKTHDMTFMSCNPGMYEEYGLKDHRSCSTNIFEALKVLENGKRAPRDELEVRGTDPFNVFQNTPAYTLKRLGCSRKGDWVEWMVSESASAGVIVAVSCCPFDVGGFNGGRITDIGITIES